MATRPALYHPYKRPTPQVSPAGFRIQDYINPRRCFDFLQGHDFTNLLRSPLKCPRHQDDDAQPTHRRADPFANGGFTSARPSTPAPDDHRNAVPDVKKTSVSAQDPLPCPRRRKVKYGPRHLSLSSGTIRSGTFPRRRAQQTKEKRDRVHNKVFDRHARRVARAREGLSKLRMNAEAVMTPKYMSNEDKIFLKQLRNLELSQVMDHDLEQCRQRLELAAAEATERRREHEERDEAAAKMWGGRQDEEALEEQKRKVAVFVQASDDRWTARFRRMEEAALRADAKRQRLHEARERQIREEQERLFREELVRRAKEDEERRMREAEERRQREEWRRRLMEEVERRLREEQMRKLQEEGERLRREAYERQIREERERFAKEREARFLAEQARRAASKDEQLRQHFVLYEAKWNELRTSTSLPPIDVREMPWPVLGVVSSADQITYENVRTFLFHPLRPGVEGKTTRDKVKSEVLRFHPDKFNTRILPKIRPSQQAIAQAIAGVVARILTRIMTEELEQEK